MNSIAVIGGGASGLAAAISAASMGAHVTVYESGARVGRKILATGNGRCNMTNRNASAEHYHGADVDFVRGAQEKFWVEDTLGFFLSLGVITKTEQDGRVYPYSDRASSVLDALRLKLDTLGVRVVTNYEVKSVKRKNNRFLIVPYRGESETADAVIVATGGRAAPNLGSKGGGYDILKGLGHTVTDTRPSLVQLKTETETVKKLKGIRITAEASIDGASEYGEILFTDYGLSGIAIFSLTAYLDKQKTVSLDIMSGTDKEELISMLTKRAQLMSDVPLESYFTGMLDKRVGQALLKSAGITPLSRPSRTLTETEITRLAEVMKKWEFKIEGTMSWNNAQTTKGGAVTREFDKDTMESKIVKGLYAAGEVLDIDGDCGGYNLQWAWSSGCLAGRNAALREENHK